MTFVPENELERALVQAATNPSAWGAFYRLLFDSELLALGYADFSTSVAQDKIQIAQITFKDRLYHPIFSASIRLDPYAKEHPRYFSMKGRDLFESTRGAYFLLNPGSDYTKELLPEELAELLQPQPAPGSDRPAGEILITQPGLFPVALADALRKLFASRPEIEAAYLAQMAIAGRNEPPHPIVGVKLVGPWEPLAQEIERIVAPLQQGTRLAAMPLTGEGPRKAMGDMLMRFEPFYTRQSRLH